MSRLQENLDEILRQKQTYLKPENLRQGITAYGIEGQMTTENMWLPQYSSEGDYYILSFVNLDGNSNVEKIVGYDGYRIVKFYNDTRWYIFDVRMNKPKQITNDVIVASDEFPLLLGATDTDVYYVLGKTGTSSFTIHKCNIISGEVTQTFTKSGESYQYLLPENSDGQRVKDFIIWTSARASTSTSTNVNANGFLFKYNPETNTLTTLRNFSSAEGYQMAAKKGHLQFIGNKIVGFGVGTASTEYTVLWHYDTDTKAVKTIVLNDKGSAYQYAHALTPDGNYYICGTKLYTYDFSAGIGVVVGTTPFTDSKHTYILWITSTVCMYGKTLYKYNPDTLTFTKVVNTTFNWPQLSSTYLDVIVGYEFLDKKYYFNTGSSIIKDNKILNGYFARDQYNQTVQGTMPNHAAITINPSIETQTIGEGYTSGITVNPVTYEIDSDIKPENIRYGVNILGVAGTLEQDAAESVMSQEEYDACMSVANDILGITE